MYTNSPVPPPSQVLDQFMKELALPFLHAAVRNPVQRLFDDRVSCELDPTRKGSPENCVTLLGECAVASDTFMGLSKRFFCFTTPTSLPFIVDSVTFFLHIFW